MRFVLALTVSVGIWKLAWTACGDGDWWNGTACVGCEGDMIVGVNGTCVCPQGTERNGETLCVPCLLHAFAVSGESCEECDVDQVVKREGVGCVGCTEEGWVPSSKNETCVPCVAGTAELAEGYCEECPVGMVSEDGAGGCTSCLLGRNYTLNASTCSICAPGTIPSSTHTSCIPCPVGTRQDGTDCVDCDEGAIAGSGETECLECDGVDMYADVDRCKTCGPGWIPNSVHSSCIPCPLGEYEDQSNAGICSPCPIGEVAEEGSDSCTPCRGPDQYARTFACALCPSDRVPNTDHSGCVSCPDGSIESILPGVCIPTSPTPVDYCPYQEQTPYCFNSGSCVPPNTCGNTASSCTCRGGHSGTRCSDSPERASRACDGVECHQGVCVVGVGEDAMCLCKDGYEVKGVGGACLTGTKVGCGDGVKGEDESDVDCGGDCGVCSEGQRCMTESDCAPSLVCSNTTLRCTPPCIPRGTKVTFHSLRIRFASIRMVTGAIMSPWLDALASSLSSTLSHISTPLLTTASSNTVDFSLTLTFHTSSPPSTSTLRSLLHNTYTASILPGVLDSSISTTTTTTTTTDTRSTSIDGSNHGGDGSNRDDDASSPTGTLGNSQEEGDPGEEGSLFGDAVLVAVVLGGMVVVVCVAGIAYFRWQRRERQKYVRWGHSQHRTHVDASAHGRVFEEEEALGMGSNPLQIKHHQHHHGEVKYGRKM